ncbi:hypothetical protein AsAng_0024930 [Aureispira anguillae]|uniref:Uncharacterized protein n=1 Tax=Aureispira anguillae TaxID=2864201 RepID=A0A915YEX7_9BACT|nr:hypothetical protein AsAng_0024930 [Aureispira anguillae]
MQKQKKKIGKIFFYSMTILFFLKKNLIKGFDGLWGVWQF